MFPQVLMISSFSCYLYYKGVVQTILLHIESLLDLSTHWFSCYEIFTACTWTLVGPVNTFCFSIFLV